MLIKIKNISYPIIGTSLLLFFNGCGSGGSSTSTAIDPPAPQPIVTPPTITPPSNNPPLVTPPPTTPIVTTVSADIIASKGLPTLFSIECSRHAFDASTGNWEPQEGFVRADTWTYSNTSGTEIITIINGEVISQRNNTNDISQYPSPNIDPRRFGCGEGITTVNRVLNGVEVFNTEGSAVEADLNLANIQLKSIYYTINNSGSSVNITYSNNKLVGMVTL